MAPSPVCAPIQDDATTGESSGPCCRYPVASRRGPFCFGCMFAEGPKNGDQPEKKLSVTSHQSRTQPEKKG
eukprot:1746289-Prymnesium_polylepis.1